MADNADLIKALDKAYQKDRWGVFLIFEFDWNYVGFGFDNISCCKGLRLGYFAIRIVHGISFKFILNKAFKKES